MKLKSLLTVICVIATFALMAQKSTISPATTLPSNSHAAQNPESNFQKTITCQDTVRYPQFKEQRVGTANFYSFELWTDDGEAISQKFELGGSNMDINSIEFFGRLSPDLHPTNGGPGTVSVEAAVYSVDANNNPVTLLASNTIAITDTVFGYRHINLTTPYTVTTDYAIVIQPTSPGGIVQFFLNDVATGQTYDEDLARLKSSYYDGSNGNWVSVVDFSSNSSQWTAGTIDCEGLIAPIVSYTVDPSFTINPNPVCVDDQVTFTNTSASQGILENRMYTYDQFQTYFGLFTADSTYLYNFGDGSPVAVAENTNHTYTNAGNYTVTQFNLGGVLRGCIDNVTNQVTVDALDDASVTYSSTQYCTDGTDPVPAINSTGTFSATPAGLTFVSTSTGEIDLGNTTPGTYDITFNTNGTCPNSSTVTITVNDPATAGFSYAQATYCGDAGVATATLNAGATAGTFTSSTGLSINGFTGDVDPSNSTPGTYTVTNTVAGSGGCSLVTATQTIEIIAVDDASFTYPSSTLCLGGSNVTPSTNETGTFTATPAGLVFANAATGEINMTASTANTYSIVFSTSGACPNSSTQSITLTTSPDATFNYSAAEFCAEVGTESPSFPSGASAGAFTATPTGLSLNATSGDITLDTSLPGTYTVTNTIAASGTCAQVTETTTVVINALPSVDAGTDENVCEGMQVTLTATGADTYTWSGGITQGTAFTPTLGTTTYTVTGTDANNCVNTDDVIVEVDEEPVLNAGTDEEVCEGEAVTLSATNSVGTVTWDNGITDGTAFNPTSTTTYTATATNGACTVTDDVLVTVNPLPTVTVGADETTCVNYDPITLTGTPAGGTFSGTGVTGTEFDPNTAGVGTHVVTYTYQDGNGCESSATQTFTVEGCASIEENALNVIVIAPNPATSHVDIMINSKDLKNVQLVSAIGQVMNATVVIETNQTRVDLDNVSKGTYFLQINTVHGQTTKKLIVQ